MTLATTNDKALAVIEQQAVATLRSGGPIDDGEKAQLLKMAEYLVTNNLAPKNDTPAAVVTKFLAGRELGLAPMQAMVDLYVVNGQVMGDTRIMASQLRAGGWDYWFDETSMERATVVLRSPEGREHTLTVTYDECHEARWDQAYDYKSASWKPKPTWQGGGRAIMLRYRALSQAIRAFAADALNLRVDKVKVQRLGGNDVPNDAAVIRELVQRLGVTTTMGLVIQAQGELEAARASGGGASASGVVTIEGGASPQVEPAGRGQDDPLDGEVTEYEEPVDASGDDGDEPVSQSEQPKAQDATRHQRPYAPEVLKRAIAGRVARGRTTPADEPRQRAVAGALEQLFPGMADRAARTAARHTLMDYLVGKTTTKALTDGEASALLAWAEEVNEAGEYIISDMAIDEAALVLASLTTASLTTASLTTAPLTTASLTTAAVGTASGQQELFA